MTVEVSHNISVDVISLFCSRFSDELHSIPNDVQHRTWCVQVSTVAICFSSFIFSSRGEQGGAGGSRGEKRGEGGE